MNANPETNASPKIPVGMRPGVREFRDASLTVSIPQTLPAHMHERVREVSHVFVKPESRRQRFATILLNFVCQEADANGMTLVLTVRPYEDGEDAGAGDESGHMSEPQLIAWYERFGFQKLQELPEGWYMARQVRERPRVRSIAAAVAEAMPRVVH